MVDSSSQSSSEIAQRVIDGLARYVTDVVLCPGSRNSPLALAALAHQHLRVHVRLDERAAAFCALGMGRASGRQAAVIVTSGTAVANCLPAVVESALSHTPLAIISADRPQRYVGTGASQTIEQRGIFGGYAPTYSPENLDQAFAQSTAHSPVHINVELDTPLLGEVKTGSSQAHPLTSRFIDHGEVALDLSLDTLVIAGDEAWRVEGLEDVPTIAEPTAPAPFHPVHPLAAGLFAKGEIIAGPESAYAEYVAQVRPQQIVIVGHPTLHRAVMELISSDLPVIALSRTADFTDPARIATARGTRVKVSGAPSARWLNTCDALSRAAADTVRTVLEDPTHGFTGLHASAALADGLGVGDTLVLGASNPVRDAAMVGLPFDGVDTYSPRGAAGIDGTVSQAVGVALAVQSQAADLVRAPRTIALMGDVTFLHDASGLLIGPDNPYPENLTIVVANDNGGGIFEGLEIGAEQYRPYFEKAVGTPHNADLEALVAGYGANYRRANTMRELLEHLADLIEQPEGITVVEASTSRSTRRAMEQALRTGVGV